MVMPKYAYTAYRNNISSFGYLNCTDKVTLSPKTWFWALIGHTARTFVDPETNIAYVYEATTLNDGTRGTQITLMSDWLKKRTRTHVYYRAPVFVNKLEEEPCNTLFKQHIKKFRGLPYPDLKQWKWRWHMVNAALDLGIKELENKDQEEMMHCTQLAVHLDRYCGLVSKDVNPAEWEPDNCRNRSRIDKELAKVGKMVLTYEVELYYG